MAKIDVLGGWKTIRSLLPPEYEVLACEHQQVETKFGNAKIRNADTLLRFILLHVGADLREKVLSGSPPRSEAASLKRGRAGGRRRWLHPSST